MVDEVQLNMHYFSTILFCSVLLFYWKVSVQGVYQQKNAKVVYVNPKYAKDVRMFTYRPSRTNPYVTNLTGTILHSWGNNVTLSWKMYNKKFSSGVTLFALKACELLNNAGVKQWFSKYWGIPDPHCPLPAGTYHMVAAEIPPKNFPVMLSKGDYTGGCIATHANTKDRMAEISFEISVE